MIARTRFDMVAGLIASAVPIDSVDGRRANAQIPERGAPSWVSGQSRVTFVRAFRSPTRHAAGERHAT